MLLDKCGDGDELRAGEPVLFLIPSKNHPWVVELILP